MPVENNEVRQGPRITHVLAHVVCECVCTKSILVIPIDAVSVRCPICMTEWKVDIINFSTMGATPKVEVRLGHPSRIVPGNMTGSRRI